MCRNIVEAYEKDPEIIHKEFGIRNETLLHRAALHRRIEMVEFLLDHGAKQTGKPIMQKFQAYCYMAEILNNNFLESLLIKWNVSLFQKN